MPNNLLIIQGGGPTAVFNASLAAIVHQHQTDNIGAGIFGARSGMKGFADDDLIDLSSLSAEVLIQLRDTPGAALGSSRFAPSEDHLEACLRALKRRHIRQIVFIGGNGTMTGALKFSDFCRSRSFDVQIMGSPKTIDNDIYGTDRSPGFGSAARFVAQSTLDLAADLRSLHQPVSIFETLGRDVGWLAAASTLGKRHPDDAPHVVCIPEKPFQLDRFLSAIDDTVARLGWASAVVAEGISYADGTPVFQQLLSSGKDVPLRPLIGGVAQHLSGLVAQHLGLRCRSEKPGLISRSSTALISAQDVRDAEETARECVRALWRGETEQMIGLLPLQDGSSQPEVRSVPLRDIAGKRRAIPDHWLSNERTAVNEHYRVYAESLTDPLKTHRLPW